MIAIQKIIDFLACNYIGDNLNTSISRVSDLQDADEDSLIWIKNSLSNKQQIIDTTLAKVIITQKDSSLKKVDNKVLLLVENPRLDFIKVIQNFFMPEPAKGIHPTAYIHPKANVHSTAYIGPFSYIGESSVGKNSFIHGNVYIYDKVIIGENVVIHSGTVVGADGFGYEKDEEGNIHKFPHIGGVVIDNDVEVGANTCIDRGSLSNTVIKRGVKIDNLVHIAHNVEIEENSFIIANSMIGGSVKIGKNTWIAPSTSVMNGIKIGNSSIIGMASLVTKTVPDSVTFVGSPAKPIKEFFELQKKIKNL